MVPCSYCSLCLHHPPIYARLVQGNSSSLLCHYANVPPQKKELPPDNDRYVRSAPLNPKKVRAHTQNYSRTNCLVYRLGFIMTMTRTSYISPLIGIDIFPSV